MTTVLMWDKPERKMSTEEWQSISADSAPPGVYTPNVSERDVYKWRAKKIGGKDPRVEIRKSVTGQGKLIRGERWGSYAQVLIIVRPLGSSEGETGSVIMSMNGTAEFDATEWAELSRAVDEAREVLEH